jgi:hypothetical protein
MREPTSEEMIKGIAEGFCRYLKQVHPYGPLSESNLAKIIEQAALLALRADAKVPDFLKE